MKPSLFQRIGNRIDAAIAPGRRRSAWTARRTLSEARTRPTFWIALDVIHGIRL